MNEMMAYFAAHTTEEIAQFLLGMYLENQTEKGILAGYIVDAEAYLGPEDEAAHSFGMRKTPRLKAMYDKPGTIYLYTIHTQLVLNIVTQRKGHPQGVMIRAIEPVEGIDRMQNYRFGKIGPELSNGPGKLVKAMGITKELYGQSIFTSQLKIVPEKRKFPQKIAALPRIGIPNKGIWTNLPLRFVVSGNPYVSKQRKRRIDQQNFGWKEENK